MKSVRPGSAGAYGQHRGKKGRIRKALGLSASIIAVGVSLAHAQADQFIARSQVLGSAGQAVCPVILMIFNRPGTIVSQAMSSDGTKLTVRFAGSATTLGASAPKEHIETQPSLAIPGLGNAFVTVDVGGPNPILSIQFPAAVKAVVSQSGERSIVVAVENLSGDVICVNPAEQSAEPATSADLGLPEATAPAASAENEAGQLMAAARASITGGDYSLAVQQLTKLLGMPANEFTIDAQEMLGLARERNNQLAQARAEYEIYLQKYPNSPGAERVRQRLAAIITAQMAPPAQLREAGPGYQGPLDATATADAGATAQPAPDAGATFAPLGPQPTFAPSGGGGGFAPLPEPPPPPTFRANVSGYYYLNQSSTFITELQSNTTTSDDELLQNSFVLSVDMSDEIKLGDNTLKWRAAGDYTADFSDSTNNKFGLSQLNAKLQFGQNAAEVVLGRQSVNNDGVFGRFDGVRLNYPLNDDVVVHATAGMPVDSKADDLFGGNRSYVGASADYLGFGENIKVTGYFLNETREGYTNRMAVGAEGTYTTDSDSVYALLDADLSFSQVNIARASWNHILPDQSSYSVTAEFRKSPILTLANALQSQTVTTLAELAGLGLTEAQIRQLALDRTTDTWSLSFSYQRQLNEKWQASADASVYYTGGNPASTDPIVIDAVPAPGLEYYASAQFVGSSILRDGDVLSVAARYSDGSTSRLLLGDVYWRFDLGQDLRLKPRLRVGDRQVKSGGSEIYAIPSVTLNYGVNDTTDIEVELGTRVSNQATPTDTQATNEFFVTAGFIKSF